MPDVFLTDFEPGERELSDAEIARITFSMLDGKNSVYVRGSGVKVIAVFADDRDDLSPPEREELVLGVGASWSEALAYAKRALRDGRAAHLGITGRANA